MVLSKLAAARLKVCREQRHPHNRFNVKESCKRHDVHYENFIQKKWLDRYDQLGTPGVVKRAAGGATNMLKITPLTKAFLVKTFKEEKKNSGKALRRALTLEYQRRGTPNRSVASDRSIQLCVRAETGVSVRPPPKMMMVKTPWHARYRRQFAQQHMNDNSKTFLFTDEKIFTIYNMRGDNAGVSTFRSPNAEWNKAKQMTGPGGDDEYEEWRKENGGNKALPDSKGKGLYKLRMWGGVGYNVKTELYAHHAHMDSDVYFEECIKKRVIPMKKNPPGREASQSGRRRGRQVNEQDIWVIQDNCTIHNREDIRDFAADNGLKFVVSTPRGHDGSRDDFHHWPGVERYDTFPQYSPDINGTIEKVWRELAYRILRRYRKGDISSVDEHRNAILEEWEKLEFEEVVDEEGRTWKGINFYVRQWKRVCEEVIAQDGFDTKYM